ncbi:hypothetical protein GGI43DRAFT_280714 [Trichoderma evansii]
MEYAILRQLNNMNSTVYLNFWGLLGCVARNLGNSNSLYPGQHMRTTINRKLREPYFLMKHPFFTYASFFGLAIFHRFLLR